MNSLWDIRIFLGLVPKESHCTWHCVCRFLLSGFTHTHTHTCTCRRARTHTRKVFFERHLKGAATDHKQFAGQPSYCDVFVCGWQRHTNEKQWHLHGFPLMSSASNCSAVFAGSLAGLWPVTFLCNFWPSSYQIATLCTHKHKHTHTHTPLHMRFVRVSLVNVLEDAGYLPGVLTCRVNVYVCVDALSLLHWFLLGLHLLDYSASPPFPLHFSTSFCVFLSTFPRRPVQWSPIPTHVSLTQCDI